MKKCINNSSKKWQKYFKIISGYVTQNGSKLEEYFAVCPECRLPWEFSKFKRVKRTFRLKCYYCYRTIFRQFTEYINSAVLVSLLCVLSVFK